MRSTATFEPDVSSRLQKLVARRQQSKKAVLNEVMRCGLDALESAEVAPKPFVLVPFRSGKVLDHRSASEILDDIDAEAFLEKHPHLKRPAESR